MAAVSSNRKLTANYSSLIREHEYGGIPHGTPEYAAAMERVKAMLSKKSFGGSITGAKKTRKA